jgi:hypothetical protein
MLCDEVQSTTHTCSCCAPTHVSISASDITSPAIDSGLAESVDVINLLEQNPTNRTLVVVDDDDDDDDVSAFWSCFTSADPTSPVPPQTNTCNLDAVSPAMSCVIVFRRGREGGSLVVT